MLTNGADGDRGSTAAAAIVPPSTSASAATSSAAADTELRLASFGRHDDSVLTLGAALFGVLVLLLVGLGGRRQGLRNH